jgi:2-polyprenyl-6-methoxyphenol hydroxylase-like FAD-dependent oxidoreductase
MEGISREIPVLIAGGGPVGLMLAAELGWRGIPNLLVERDPAEERLKFSRLLVISVRTMELLRQFGAATRVRNWGFPPDHPLDNVFVTSLTGYELVLVRPDGYVAWRGDALPAQPLALVDRIRGASPP